MRQPSTYERFAAGMSKALLSLQFGATQPCVPTRAADDGTEASVDDLGFLDEREIRQLREIKARTYANIFGVLESIIAAAATGGDSAHSGLVSLSEALDQQQMFRHLERMAAASQPDGYAFAAQPLLTAALGKSPWTLLGFVYRTELFVLGNHKAGIDHDTRLSAVVKSAFLDHWREQCKHATLAQAQWQAEDAQLSQTQRASAASELIELSQAMDRFLEQQGALDADYFMQTSGCILDDGQARELRTSVCNEYRRQFDACAVSGSFAAKLACLTDPGQHAPLLSTSAAAKV